MKASNGEEISVINDYNFLMLCNNFIVDILRIADKSNWSSENITIKDKDKHKFEQNKYDLFYFRNHGYANIINKSLYKHIIFSLIADYNIYMYDAVKCAKKMHFGTAFTLLRKPLKDDLFMIEMFFVKGKRFVGKFLNNSIEKFAIDKITKEDKMKILNKCCKKIHFFTAEKMYNLRYSKKSTESLEKIWNKTLHIITTAKDYATENGNLNIIFATEETVEENLVYFYKVCCSIQLYFIILVLNILKEEMLINEDVYYKNMRNIYFAFSCTLDNDIPKEILNELDIRCNCCGEDIKISRNIIEENYKNNTFKCTCDFCNHSFEIEGFIF